MEKQYPMPKDQDLRVFRKWDDYLQMVALVEARESNRPGADKSRIERSDRDFVKSYRNVKRIR